jgi:membrane fusion protein, multidrug efflux system
MRMSRLPSNFLKSAHAKTTASAASLIILSLVLAGCDGREATTGPEMRPVRVIAVTEHGGGETITLSGVIEAKNEVDLGFRIGGRVIERFVNVGDRVSAGQLIARLDSQDEENALRAAKAALSAAEGQFLEAEINYERQRQLLDRGFTTRMRYDEVVQLVRTLGAQVDAATAQVAIARNRLDDTSLFADAPGEVTARVVETGQVVSAGQMIVRLARQDGRDAVFDVPPSILSRSRRDAPISVALSIDPSVTAMGRVREVSPQADARTGTFRVRVGLAAPPVSMRLGSTVTGRMTLEGAEGIVVPASALSRLESLPAVWVFDPKSETVSQRQVEIALHRSSDVVLSAGLTSGEIVVTAGVQTLRPGQRVRLLGQKS